MEVTYTYDKEDQRQRAATTDTVSFYFALVNTGLLSLYNIAMSDSLLKAHGVAITCTNTDGTSSTGPTAGILNGLALYPDNGLAPTGQLTCIGTDPVSQSEVLLGIKVHFFTQNK